MATIYNVEGTSLRKGLEADLVDGVLAEAELGFSTDTHKLFVGYMDNGVLRYKEVFDKQEIIDKINEDHNMNESMVQISSTAPSMAPIGGLWAIQE